LTDGSRVPVLVGRAFRVESTSNLIDDIVADADSMTDRMGRCDWKIEIVFQSIKQRCGRCRS
jgi:hypothetical protein